MSDDSKIREWNAAAYHHVSAPQTSWGKRVLARLSLRGDETVMDAGCGTGRLTAELLSALPQGKVVGVDLSHNMVAAAREHLPAKNQRADFLVADLQHLPFGGAFDGIFSTAAFHWVPDHLRLFRSLLGSLRPGGWLVAQCGGGPNLARLLARVDGLMQTPLFAHYFSRFRHPWVFNDPETAAALLGEVGFVDIETSLEPAFTVLEDRASWSTFVRTVVLRLHLDCIADEALRERFIGELADQSSTDEPAFSLDYWRLKLSGKVPA